MRARKDRQEIKAIARERFREQRGTAILLLFVYALMSGVSAGIDSITQQVIGNWAYHIVFWLGAFLLYVMLINLNGEYVRVYEGEKGKTGALFSGFAVNFWRKLGGYLWMVLLLILWALPGAPLVMFGLGMLTEVGHTANVGAILLAVAFLYGGIILSAVLSGLKMYAYAFAPYILALYPKVKAREALRLSIRMTMGYRGDLLVMDVSFIAWLSLAMAPLTLAIIGLVLVELATVGLGVFLIVIGGLGAFLVYTLFVGPYMALAQAGNFVELRDRAIREGEISLEELGLEIGEAQEVTEVVIQEEVKPEEEPVAVAVAEENVIKQEVEELDDIEDFDEEE